ncbi:MAG: hypothetical protein IKU26_00030, partial [Clostridia bacterium]|nr:hypothetical protein [Clostridia bacterium]
GVGNHGGGPSRKDLGDIARDVLPEPHTQYVHSTPEKFFGEITPTEVFDQSLHISMPGCYTSMYRVKQKHAQLEAELYFAEKIATVAYMQGALSAYPEAALQTATLDLLNAEFHDILPGSAIQCAEDAGLKLLNHGLLEAERVKIKALFALSASQAPAAEGEYPIVVFNPHPYELCDNVECEFMLADQNWQDDILSKITVLDEHGNPVPYQVIKEESNLNLDWRKRIIFEAHAKPLTLTRYQVYVEFVPTKKVPKAPVFTFDNGRKYVEIDPDTGLLTSYKINGVEYLGAGFGLCSFTDNADPWGMAQEQLVRMGTGEKPFALSRNPAGPFKGMQSVQVVEDGDIYLGVEAYFECDNTRARILYKIYKNNDDVDMDVTLYMGDIDQIIKLKLPLAAEGTLLGQTAFGTDTLFTDGRENVAHRFVAVDQGDQCVALLNKGVYGSHYEQNSIYMSLVRGVTYCAHPIPPRPLLPENRFTKKIDQGENNYSFRLTVGSRNQLERKTAEFVMPPYALNIFPIPGKEKALVDFDLELGGEIIAMPAMKKARDKDALILRLLNNTPAPADSYVKFKGQYLPLHFGKYEVKTIVYENGSLAESEGLLI